VNGSAVQRRSRETGGASPSAEADIWRFPNSANGGPRWVQNARDTTLTSSSDAPCAGVGSTEAARWRLPSIVAPFLTPWKTCELRGLMRMNSDSVVRGGHFLQGNWQFESAAPNVRNGPNSSTKADIAGGQRGARRGFVSLQPNGTEIGRPLARDLTFHSIATARRIKLAIDRLFAKSGQRAVLNSRFARESSVARSRLSGLAAWR
jgi:hypothetical protein